MTRLPGHTMLVKVAATIDRLEQTRAIAPEQRARLLAAQRPSFRAYMMPRRFWIVQAVASIVAAFAIGPFGFAGAVFDGIVGAQASLLGMWMGLGPGSRMNRRPTVLAGFTWLTVVMFVRPDFNGWELLLLALRLGIVSGVFLVVRVKGYEFHNMVERGEGLPFQFHIRHLFALTFLVALVLAAMRMAKNTGLMLHLVVVVLAGSFALLAIVPAWTVFAEGRPGWRVFVLAVCVALTVTSLSLTAYFQTGSVATAMNWCLRCITEALFAALTCAWLRRRGYGVCRMQELIWPFAE